MKVLIINWRDTKHPKSGGAEQVTMQHAKGWVKRGHEVVWLTSGYLDVPRDELIDGVQIIRRGGSLSIYVVAPFYLIYLVLRGVRFDVVIDEVHGIPFFTPFYLPFPKVVFIHEIAGKIWDVMWSFPINILGKFLERVYLFFYRPLYFWTDAPSTIHELEEYGIPKNQCFAIPCPITTPSSVIHKQKEKEFTCIFVSRVVKMKGIEDVIRAFREIVKTYPKSSLWIIGSGDDSYHKELEKLILSLGVSNNVTFFGSVSEQKKYELYSRAHLLLHASIKEGWGLVVLEAAYQGTPAIVYDVPGLRDTVKDNETGILVSNKTPESLAKAAIFLYEHKKQYQRLQKNGKEWARSLRWEDSINASENLLKRVIHEY